jgi:hypothetical protein
LQFLSDSPAKAILFWLSWQGRAADCPGRWRPLSTLLLGQACRVIQTLICLLGLIIFGTIGTVLRMNLLRKKHCAGLIQSTAPIAFCVWNGSGATNAIFRLGKHFYDWLAWCAGTASVRFLLLEFPPSAVSFAPA